MYAVSVVDNNYKRGYKHLAGPYISRLSAHFSGCSSALTARLTLGSCNSVVSRCLSAWSRLVYAYAPYTILYILARAYISRYYVSRIIIIPRSIIISRPASITSCQSFAHAYGMVCALESFQHEIGCRILRVPKFYSKTSVRIGLHWPTVATRTLIRKLNFLSKLLSGSNDTISRRVFSSLAVEDVYESSIVQQCRMLESKLGTHVLAKCLSDPENAPDVVRSCKESILRSDLTILTINQPSHE